MNKFTTSKKCNHYMQWCPKLQHQLKTWLHVRLQYMHTDSVTPKCQFLHTVNFIKKQCIPFCEWHAIRPCNGVKYDDSPIQNSSPGLIPAIWQYIVITLKTSSLGQFKWNYASPASTQNKAFHWFWCCMLKLNSYLTQTSHTLSLYTPTNSHTPSHTQRNRWKQTESQMCVSACVFVCVK